jgi:hypothetical protein
MNPSDRDAPDPESAGPIDRSVVGRASVPLEMATGRVDGKVGAAAASSAGTAAVASAATEPVEAATGRPLTTAPGTPSAAGAPVRRTAPVRPAGTAAVTPGAPPSTGAARVAEAVRSARSTVSAAASRGPRRARLFVKRVDPWSVMKFSFAVSFVMFFVLVVATSVLYLALDSMHVFTSLNKAIAEIVGGNNKNVKITAGVVIGASGALGLVMVVLLTALSTLAAFIYNVCADLVGGIEVTLSEKE